MPDAKNIHRDAKCHGKGEQREEAQAGIGVPVGGK